MKKIMLLSALFGAAFSVGSVSAQSFYASADVGYMIGAGASYGYNSYDNYDNSDDSDDYSSYESTKFSLGKGINYGINIGYDITENIAVELGMNIFKGSNVEDESEYSYNSYYDGSSLNIDTSTRALNTFP